MDLSDAEPTYTHMAISMLLHEGYVSGGCRCQGGSLSRRLSHQRYFDQIRNSTKICNDLV